MTLLISSWNWCVQNNNSSEAESAYLMLRASGNLRQAAALIPYEVRERIIGNSLSTLSMKELVRYEPNRLSRIQRVAEVDRLFSSNGIGTIRVQVEWARALRMEERYEEAADVLKALWQQIGFIDVLRRYCRVLTRLGKTELAFKGVLPGLDSSSGGVP